MAQPERINLSDAVARIQKLLFPDSIPRWPYEPGMDLVEHAVADQIVTIWGTKPRKTFLQQVKQMPVHPHVDPMLSTISDGDAVAWNQVQIDWPELWPLRDRLVECKWLSS